MLISAHIHKFRSCEDVEIKDFGDITAFIGRNGAGKTNILKAIEWAARVCSASGKIPAEISNAGKVELLIKFDNDIYKYRISYGFGDGGYIFSEMLTRNSCVLFLNNDGFIEIEDKRLSIKIDNKTPSSNAILSLLPNDAISCFVSKVIEFMNSVRFYEFYEMMYNNSNDLISHDDYKKWEIFGKIDEDKDREILIKIIYLWSEERDLFYELTALLGVNGLGIISDIKVRIFNLPGLRYNLIFSMKHLKEEHFFSFGALSFGTRRVVHLLTSMLYDKASVALIEQPEDGIHPGLLQKIIQLLRDYANPNQFILTSHSPYVLNRLKPEEIRMVDMKEGKTRVRALDAKEIEIANDFIENEGALSEFIDSIEEL